MKCEFWMTGTFGVAFNDGTDVYHVYSKMDDAVDFIQNIWEDDRGMTADVVDMTTGEILLHFEDEDPDPEVDDCDFEMGFNPYLGLFDWDC